MIAIPADKLVLPSEKQTIPSDNTGASDEDALGLFDLSDMMERTTAAIVVLVSDWGNEIELLGAAMKDSTEQLNNMSKFGQPDQQLVRTAEQLDQFAEFGEAKIEEIESEMSEFISTFQGIADVSKDFNSTQDDIDNTAHSIEQLVVGMEGAMDGTRSFADSVAALPRLSKEFNKSRARVVRVQKKFLDLMEQNLRDLLEVKLTVESLLPYAAESD
jgi:methyl-accepting chemotaxis protein